MSIGLHHKLQGGWAMYPAVGVVRIPKGLVLGAISPEEEVSRRVGVEVFAGTVVEVAAADVLVLWRMSLWVC